MHELLWSWDETNNVPPQLGSPLRARLESLLSSTPSPWSVLPPSLEHVSPNTTLLIAGFGREGESTYQYLRTALSPTLPLVVVDDKAFEELSEIHQNVLSADPSCTYYQTNESGWKDLISPLVFKTPGLPLHHPVVKHIEQANWKVLTNTKLFFEVLQTWLGDVHQEYKIIGVTGTKGKSTTTSLIHHILKTAGLPAFLGGNIGVPPLDLLPDMYKEMSTEAKAAKTYYIVLEMSAHQLADLDISPHIAVVQNIVPEHLDYYPDFETYKAAKSNIARYQKPSDCILFDPSLEAPMSIARLSAAHQLHFGTSGSTAWVENQHILNKNVSVMNISDVPLLGTFNLTNVLPGVALATHLGIAPEVIRQGVTTFRPLPHRLEKVREHHGVLYVNDSLSTIPEAAQNAISSLAPRPIILLAGGYDRHLSFEAFAEFLTNSTVKKLILFLPTGAYILENLQKLRPAADKLIQSAVVVRTMADAVTLAHQSAEPGDVVLLSPASASFGEFKDYKDRGDQFALLCRNLQ
jgi:UDP-N-acetylmuramoylalanine--D-glutamate ligase